MEPNKKLLEEYTQKMEEAIDNNDKETGHVCCDMILCELLRHLGYDDVINAYNKQQKWYS